MRLSEAESIVNVKTNRPDLLAWERLEVKVIKDPAALLSKVSDLGVIHAGLEANSAIYRICDKERSFIVKQHFDPEIFRREVANISFANRSGAIAPYVFFKDEKYGTIVMEDLGDRSLAYLWHEGRMEEYFGWACRAMSILAAVQADFERNKSELATLYGTTVPERHQREILPKGLSNTLDEVLHISRNLKITEADCSRLDDTERQLRKRIIQFNDKHKGFLLDLTPWHVIEKDGAIRVLDLTGPPIGGLIGQFNFVWHLERRREVIEYYLEEKRRLGCADIDAKEFLWLEDGLQLLECAEWIRNHCKQILENESWFTNLDGSKPEDYVGSEKNNLEAIYHTLEPHDDLGKLIGLLKYYFEVSIKGS